MILSFVAVLSLRIKVGLGLLALGAVSNGAFAECTGEPATTRRLRVDAGEVFDRETGLIWARCSVGTTWVEGKGCMGTVTRMSWGQANRAAWPNGWRLPSPEELQTLVAENCRNPSLDARMFPKTVPDLYWTNRRGVSYCWYNHFCNDRDEDDDGHWYRMGAVRLVRDAR